MQKCLPHPHQVMKSVIHTEERREGGRREGEKRREGGRRAGVERRKISRSGLWESVWALRKCTWDGGILTLMHMIESG